MCTVQLQWTGWLLITRCCYFKASLSLGMTAKPVEDLSAMGNECPPEGCPALAPGRRNLASWQAFHPPFLVVTCASMPVIESLTQLFSCYNPSSLTSHPQGYIKICSPKGSWKWDTLQPLIPVDTSSCAHKDGSGVFRGRCWAKVSKHLGLGSCRQIFCMLGG